MTSHPFPGKKKKLFLILAFFVSIFFQSCNNSDPKDIAVKEKPADNTPVTNADNNTVTCSDATWNKVQDMFQGRPAVDDFKTKLTETMQRYGLKVDDENVMNSATQLTDLSKQSKKGVTEMQILNHMHLNGYPATSVDFSKQAAISAQVMEANQ